MQKREAGIFKKESFLKRFYRRINKKIFIPVFVLLILLALFLVYYKYFVRGYLIISATPSGYTLEINGQKFDNIEKTKKLWLKPDVYSIRITKDKYLEHDEFINVRPLRITRIDYQLLEMNYAGLIDDNQSLNSFPVYASDNQGIIYFSHRDKTFYKSSFETTYIAANNQSEKIDIDLGLAETDEVVDIKYSPSANLALLFVTNGSLENKVKYLNFAEGRTDTLSSPIEDADWLTDTEIVAIENASGNKQVSKISLPTQNKETISSLSTEAASIFGLNNGKTAVALYDFESADKYSVIDINAKKSEEKVIKDSYITDVIKSYQSDRFVLLDSQTDRTRVFAAKGFEEAKELNINPMLNLAVLNPSGDNLTYLKFNKDENSYIFERYYFDKNETKLLGKYTNSDFEGAPSSILVKDEYINFIINNNILSFKIK